MKDQLKTLVSQGRTEEIINQLLNLTRKLGNEKLDGETILISAWHEKYRKDSLLGTSTKEEQKATLNSLNESILAIINQLPDEIPARLKLKRYSFKQKIIKLKTTYISNERGDYKKDMKL